jgi:hypothetical protein
MNDPVRVAVIALAFIGLGPGSLTLSTDLRGAGAPVRALHNVRAGDAIAPQEIAKAYTPAGVNTAPYPSLTAFDPKYRFGFLEFEDAPQ